MIPGLIVFFFQSPFPLKRCTNPSRSPTWFKRNIEGGEGKKGNLHDVPSKTTPTWMKKRGPSVPWPKRRLIVGVDNPSWDVGYPFCGWFSCSFPLVWLEHPRILFVKPYNLVCWTAFHGKSHIVWFNTTIVWIGIFLLGLVSIQTTKKHVLMISPSKAGPWIGYWTQQMLLWSWLQWVWCGTSERAECEAVWK